MHKTTCFKATLLAVAMFTITGAQAAPLTKEEYKAGKTRIGAEYKAAKEACGSLAGNTKDICMVQAKGKDKVALAELEYAYTNKPKDQTAAMVAMAKAKYAVSKEKCDDKAGNQKDVCVKEAKSVQAAELADAKLDKKIGEAKVEAKDDKRDAEYKVAIEKCDAMDGVAKSSCVAAAKGKYGKS